eukprot:6210900-Pleurochrysis_carterae.AAC.4
MYPSAHATAHAQANAGIADINSTETCAELHASLFQRRATQKDTAMPSRHRAIVPHQHREQRRKSATVWLSRAGILRIPAHADGLAAVAAEIGGKKVTEDTAAKQRAQSTRCQDAVGFSSRYKLLTPVQASWRLDGRSLHLANVPDLERCVRLRLEASKAAGVRSSGGGFSFGSIARPFTWRGAGVAARAPV